MSDAITITYDGPASVVTFTQPPFNLLDIETIDNLVAAHREADAHEGTRVIVTRSGLEGMFCNGLNPMTVLEADYAGRRAVFDGVARLVKGLYTLRKPHIAVLNGPAMAGGAVLAILADFRYMDSERGAICFAEAKVGVPVPPGMVAVIASVCQPNALREIVMLGKKYDPAPALEVGLVDGIAPGAELDALVDKQVARLSRLSLDVLIACKASLRASIVEKTNDPFASNGACKHFMEFVGDEYLGEGLRAFLEGRQPVFVR